ncbi:MAG TPA: hypothetical protein VFR23_04010 [Jiangellaceae bacterium]|nr:hypothetical protein [Jiangellaceae bacterium]
MGANVIRLVRTDHRRITDIADRLGRRYRAGESLPAQLGTEIRAHAVASGDCLLPFAEDRITKLDPAYAETLDELVAAAEELENSPHPVPPPVVERVTTAVRRHIEVEEAAVLDELDQTVTVERLRLLGETFKRGRDAALKAQGEWVAKYSRPRVSRAELYERARYRGIAGRSAMSRSELLSALKESQ